VVSDVAEVPIRVDRGVFTVPQGPGLGVEVDEALLAKLAS
jgi:L-alanine-DL-glutamate epimerase-like enolase superfamily enzyme